MLETFQTDTSILTSVCFYFPTIFPQMSFSVFYQSTQDVLFKLWQEIVSNFVSIPGIRTVVSYAQSFYCNYLSVEVAANLSPLVSSKCHLILLPSKQRKNPYSIDLPVHDKRTAAAWICAMEQQQSEFSPQIQVPHAYIVPDLYQLGENSVQNKKKTEHFGQTPASTAGSEHQLPF